MSKRATSKPAKAKAAPKAVKKAAAKPAARAATSAKSKPAARAVAKPAAKPKAPMKTVAPAKPKATTRAAGKAQDKKLTAKASTSTIVLAPDYRPSEDEPFMNERHRMYFRQKLSTWKEEIIRQTRETLAGLHEDSTQHADLADRATSETDRALELRARDRQRKLIAKIDAALARIEDGTYGYCEETGEPIGLKRLDARPIATLSLEAQERHERRERVYRED
jgi:DnaK suppressor protein